MITNSHRSRTEPKWSVLSPKRRGKHFKKCSVLSNTEVDTKKLIAFGSRVGVSDCQKWFHGSDCWRANCNGICLVSFCNSCLSKNFPFNLSCHIYWYKIFIIFNYQLILYGIYNGVLYFILDVGSLSLPLFIFICLARRVSILLTFSVEHHLVLLVHSMLFLFIQLLLFFMISFLLLILSLTCSSFFSFLM